MRHAVRLLALALCTLAGLYAGPAEARRVALVIGNAAYKVGPLANPVSDAAAVADALERQLRFDKVMVRNNLGREGFRVALQEMARESLGAEFGVIYFAGHGMEVAGRNFLIPIDATLAAAHDVDLEAIALDTVLGQLGGVRRLKLVILDACRNNPFAVAGIKRNVSRGLARIEPEGNILVAYAAKDGTTADDGRGRHSPFTEALVRRIATRGLDVRRLFGYVSEDVLAATNRVQEPYLYGRLGGEEIFLHPQAPAVSPPGEAAETARVCREVEGMSNLATLAVLERQQKGRPAGECITARIEELKKGALPTTKAEPEAGVFNPLRNAVPLTLAEERALRPGSGFRECDACPEMVVVPAGAFTMGSPANEPERELLRNGIEGPQHRVTLPRPFAVGRFEVTFAEWEACVAAGGCRHQPKDQGWGRGRQPVVDVSWNDITYEYLPWLSRRAGKVYRLLTEAEWEYAARAGTTTPFSTGRTITTGQANFNGDGYAGGGKGEGRRRPVAVGSFPPNAFGLHDMHGNVFEQVQDCWNNGYAGAPSDGSAWTSGDCTYRVLRGGSWDYRPQAIRSASREWYSPTNRNFSGGFRVARSL